MNNFCWKQELNLRIFRKNNFDWDVVQINSVFKGSCGEFNGGSETFPDAQHKTNWFTFVHESMTMLTLFAHTTDHD